MHLTPQISKQCGQLEAGEIGCGGKHRACSVGWRVGKRGQDNGARGYSKEADEDGAQDKNHHYEDEESGLGVDVCSHQAHQQTQQGDDCAIKQRPPVARWQDLVGRGRRPI